ncbi:glutathionyl-hydroquinone reductase YqjG-like [Sycon ciliatum]|uniref:glutathionyl-hydroquinone reductase YqjG-like n=1 Tax=Sycon ciliatum TaxID=27933 RepID=UPI0031F6B332
MTSMDASETEAKRAPVTSIREWVRADPDSEFPAESGRYHLYLSLACPFASRAYFMLVHKGLENVISKSIVHYLRPDAEKGWEFTPGHYRTDADTVNGKKYMREIYEMCAPEYSGRITVPVFFDKKMKRIVSTESGDILRMLSTEFNAFCETDEQRQIDLYPEGLRDSVDEMNTFIGDAINSGVYGCGLATVQEKYDASAEKLFSALDKLEDVLSKSRYILGDRMTESDVRLFTSLARFDMVYHGLFKCNKRRLVDYPNLWAFTRDLYQLPGIDATVDRFHIETHYPSVFKQINPHGIISIGPQPLDFNAPHGRDTQFSA